MASQTGMASSELLPPQLLLFLALSGAEVEHYLVEYAWFCCICHCFISYIPSLALFIASKQCWAQASNIFYLYTTLALQKAPKP